VVRRATTSNVPRSPTFARTLSISTVYPKSSVELDEIVSMPIIAASV
jgi:hypothetical protein